MDGLNFVKKPFDSSKQQQRQQRRWQRQKECIFSFVSKIMRTAITELFTPIITTNWGKKIKRAVLVAIKRQNTDEKRVSSKVKHTHSLSQSARVALTATAPTYCYIFSAFYLAQHRRRIGAAFSRSISSFFLIRRSYARIKHNGWAHPRSENIKFAFFIVWISEIVWRKSSVLWAVCGATSSLGLANK